MYKKIGYLFLLCFCSLFCFAQTDSLAGFDHSTAQRDAKYLNVSTDEYTFFIKQQKRKFIKEKYHLHSYSENQNSFYYSPSSMPATNIDFETGNFTGWTEYSGSNANSLEISDNGFAVGPSFNAVLGPGFDPVVGMSLTSPLGGNKVARVNYSVTNTQQSKIRNTINVTPKNNLLKFAYSAVIQRVGHACNDQPFFAVLLKDTTGALLFKFMVEVRDTAYNSAQCYGYNQNNFIYVPSALAYYSTWAIRCVDLTPYIGRNILIEVVGGACTLTGHWGYGYFDAKLESCPDHGKPNNLLVNSQSIDLDNNFMYYYNSNCTSSVNISAPSWPSYVNWNGPSGSGIYSLSQPNFTTNFNGLYTLSMGNNSVCPITKSIYLSANTQPTITTTATNSNVCINTPFTITLSGAQNYTWNNNVIGPVNIITPTSLGLFTISAVCSASNGCSVTKTYTFNCNGLPNVSITGTPNICSTINPTLIANGANSYVWSSPSSTFTTSGSTVTGVFPTNIVTVIGTDANGCKSTAVQTIGITYPIPNIAFAVPTPTICLGQSTGLYVAGVPIPATTIPPNTFTVSNSSTSYTVTGSAIPSSLTPTVSTVYTLSAWNYCGLFTQTFAINVQTLIPTVNATAISPQCSSNLTVNLNGADTYTLNAGPFSSYSIIGNTAIISYASNTVIVSGTYTTSMCSNTQTLYPTVIIPSYTLIPLSPICANSVSTFSVTNASAVYSITPLNSFHNPIASTFTTNTTFTTVPPTGTFYYRVDAYDANGCFGSSHVPFSTNNPTISSSINTITSTSYTLCNSQNATVTLSGCNTYTWDNASNSATLVLNPSISTIYTVQGSNACSTTTQTISITVVPSATTPVTINSPTFTLCKPYCLTFTATGASSYTWQNNSTASTILACASSNTNNLFLRYTDVNGCRTSTTITYYGYQPTLSIVGPDTVCYPFITGYTPVGAGNYTWAIQNSLGITYSVSTNFSLYPHPSVPTSIWTLTLAGKDASNCTASVTKTILVSKPPVIQTNNIITKCPGAIDSLIVLNPSVSVSSFTWNSSLVTNSFVFTPSATIIYTIQTKYNSFGCIATKIVTVDIYPPTPVSLSLSANQGCEGVPISITTSPTNAAISSNGYTYPTFYPTSAGTYTLNCFIIDANSCINKSATQTVIVFPNPNVSFTTTQNNFCQNSNSITLVGSPSGGTFYGDNVVGNTYVPNNSTTCSVIYKYTGANGCSGFDQQCIVVNPIPNMTVNSGSICPGNSFTIVPTGASSYTYSSGNPVSPNTTTTYTVTGSNAAACSATALSTVFVYPSPSVIVVSSMPLICIGQSASLIASGTNSYSWNVGGNTSTLVVTPSVTTNYYVTGANQYGCTFVATITQSVDACTGTISQKTQQSFIKIFPNPNKGEFFIENSSNEILEFSIHNTLGQEIIQQKIQLGTQNIDLSSFSNGIYYYSIKLGSTISVGKIIKE